MLSLKHPELNQILSSLPVGLLTVRTDENKLILILKLSKEMILAAKITRGFRISFVPYSVNKKTTMHCSYCSRTILKSLCR